MELSNVSIITNDISTTLSAVSDVVKEIPTLEPSCYIINTKHLVERLWLVTILGSTVSTISIIENAFLFIIFVTSKQHRRSHSLYLLLLALTDLFISLTYILIMSIKVLYEYNEWLLMKKVWMSYVVPMMTMSHVAITSSSFLIVFATVERFCITASSRYVEFLQNNRCYIALIAVLIGVFTKGTLLFEIKPVHVLNCIGTLNEYHLELTTLVIYNEHYKLFRFWFRNIVTILFPFFTLMFLNARIVNELRKNFLAEKHNVESTRTTNAKERKARIRAATRTLMFVACTYLLANMLNVIITIWEHTDAKSLFSSFLDFYIFSVDTVSLLTIVACTLRLPIYASCQPSLRAEMIHFATAFCKRPRDLNDERNEAQLINHNEKENNETRTEQASIDPRSSALKNTTLDMIGASQKIVLDSKIMIQEKQNLNRALMDTLRVLQESNKRMQTEETTEKSTIVSRRQRIG
ncbi:G-protein coupled receptor [Dirofilaria immitis]